MDEWKNAFYEVPEYEYSVLGYSKKYGYLIGFFSRELTGDVEFFDESGSLHKDVVYWMELPFKPEN